MWKNLAICLCLAVTLVAATWIGDIGVIKPQSVSAQSATCPGDFNGDGAVNLADFLAFAGSFGTRSGDANYDARIDLDGSGAIDLSDFLAFAEVFGTTCGRRPVGDDTVPEKTELKHPKVGSALDELIAGVEAGAISEEEAAQQTPLYRGKSVAVTIYVSSNVDGLVNLLEANEVSPRNAGEDYIEAFVPVLLLRDISGLAGVQHVRPIIVSQPPQAGPQRINGDGPAVHGSLDWNEAGLNGQDIKVGIIDNGFIGLSEHLGHELPEEIEARCYRTDNDLPSTKLQDCETETIHGTASAETIIDIAPQASLYVANAWTEGDTEDAVRWMISNGVRVINGSLRRMFDGPGDGTSPFSNSPLNVLDRAVNAGIVWVNSAGNDSQTTWYGAPSDEDRDGVLEFGNSREEITVTFPDSKWSLTLQLRWAGSWGGETRDLDFYVYDTDDTVVAKSVDPQTGMPWHNAYELVWLNGGGTYRVKVVSRGNDLPRWIQLLSMIGRFDHYTGNGSITSPAESANPGMLAVGAAHWRRPDAIESYSSLGPAPDGRTKPDIVGAACGETATYNVYCGTSQASPHVAGMAALVRQRFPDHTPAQVADYLTDNAEQRVPNPDPNNTWGHGFAVLPPLPGDTADWSALVALYNATNGPGWTNRTNWLSDRPLGEWYGVTTDANGRVTSLRVSENNLRGSLPAGLGNLSKLVQLDLSRNDLTGNIPAELGKLTILRELNLYSNLLTGGIPSTLGSLTNLQRLLLSYTRLTGAIPAELGGLSDLQTLDLSYTRLTGSIPTSLGNLTNLTRLDLRKSQLTNAIPSSLGNLSSLQYLYLYGNQLRGTIPSELGNLSELRYLELQGNRLGGAIPSSLGNLRSLLWLRLYGNQLTGAIPPSVGNLSKLQELRLNDNQLTGSIPSELGALTTLEGLYLNDNAGLSGSLPASFTGLRNLNDLSLSGTSLCAPADASFQAWLEGVVNKGGVVDCDDNGAPKMYWTDAARNKIQRANLDGSGVEDLVATNEESIAPLGLALNVGTGKMYWASSGVNGGPGKIQRANLDGGGVEDLVNTGLAHPVGLVLDVSAGKMYWTDYNAGKIRRANLDGSGMEDLVTTGNPAGLFLDLNASKMYWAAGTSGGVIQRSNLDGTGVRNIVSGLGDPHGLALDPDTGKIYWTIKGFYRGADKIQRANLDGSVVEDLVTTGSGAPNALALDSSKIYWTEQGPNVRTGKIRRANLDGSGVEDLVTELHNPFGLALDISGQIGTGDDGSTEVFIPDANLRAVIEDSLGKASGARITRTEMAMLTRLEAQNKGIGDLTGLEYAVNLTRIDLSEEQVSSSSVANNNSFSDLSPLANLTRLTWLDLSYNDNISDISSLSGLINLTHLNLSTNSRISDFSTLSSLANLADLYLFGISDVSVLSGLTNLKTLSINSTDLSDISSLSGLTNLSELRLTGPSTIGTDISDLSSLSGLTNLTKLRLSGHRIADISSLSGLTNLTELYFSFAPISDISPLSGLTRLTKLGFHVSNISDISSLSSLTNLTWLNFTFGDFSDISSLSGLTNLTYVRLIHCRISDLAPLVANTGLGDGDEVNVENNPLSAMSRNTHIPALRARGVDVRF
ncbi:MAG: leucine-rich repeat domain-containing protein [Gemmatimonadota bacterium]|nr:leucine-rich repeat domain-containing protein [Gemmatimonadota bacterium]